MNRLPGVISAVQYHDRIALIDVTVTDSICCSAIQIGLEQGGTDCTVGSPVMLYFKEFEVSIARQLQGMISLRNRFQCRIVSLERGEIMTRIILQCQHFKLSSVITTRSVNAMLLKSGDEVEALVKANEMNILVSE